MCKKIPMFLIFKSKFKKYVFICTFCTFKEKKMTVKELNQLYWIDKCIYQAEIQDPCGHSVCIVRKVDV